MRNLFRPPTEATIHTLEAALTAICTATPLSRAHAKELPFAVRDLSRLLTQDRSKLSQSYWINKRLLSAYCRYFLPWNLVRLSWLLPGLDLTLTEGDTVLDLGSGPLTMPIALWVAKPEWRATPLTIVCCDVAPGPLGAGREIFRALAPDSPWKIELRRGPIDKTLRSFSGKAALITAANVLNEFKPSRETSLENQLAAFGRSIAARLAPEGRFLAVEPGTRLGGKLMATLRHAAFSSHLLPESPCPHWGECPMLSERATGWCHFSHTTNAAPKELTTLTARAKLEKHSLSLACMLLRPATTAEREAAEAKLPELAPDQPWNDGLDDDWGDDFSDTENAFSDAEALAAWANAYAAVSHPAGNSFIRVISDPIRLPDRPDPARYGCSAKGLVLAHGTLRIPSGAAVAIRWPEKETRDGKTGAVAVTVAPPAAPPGKKTPTERPAPRGPTPRRNAASAPEKRNAPARAPRNKTPRR